MVSVLDAWLTERVSIEEVEAAHAVRHARLGPDPVAFGFQHEQWERMKRDLQPGDELWEFCSPPDTWQNLCGRKGIAIVRDGTIVAHLTTALS